MCTILALHRWSGPVTRSISNFCKASARACAICFPSPGGSSRLNSERSYPDRTPVSRDVPALEIIFPRIRSGLVKFEHHKNVVHCTSGLRIHLCLILIRVGVTGNICVLVSSNIVNRTMYTFVTKKTRKQSKTSQRLCDLSFHW